MTIHPAFDMKTATWFHGDLEAPSLAELRKLLPPRTKIKDYYPKGYHQSANWPKGPTIRHPIVQSSFILKQRATPPIIKKANGHNPVEHVLRSQKERYKRCEPKAWNANEITYLKENYGEMTPRQIANHLGRNRNQVIGKANRLGLRTNNQPDRLKAYR